MYSIIYRTTPFYLVFSLREGQENKLSSSQWNSYWNPFQGITHSRKCVQGLAQRKADFKGNNCKLMHKITRERMVAEYGTVMRQGSYLPLAFLRASGWPWVSQFTSFPICGMRMATYLSPIICSFWGWTWAALIHHLVFVSQTDTAHVHGTEAWYLINLTSHRFIPI